jgi:hypothetical protein
MSYYYCIYDCTINGKQCYGDTCKSLQSWNEYLNNPTYPIDFNSYFFRKVSSIDEVPIGSWGNGSKQMQKERKKWYSDKEVEIKSDIIKAYAEQTKNYFNDLFFKMDKIHTNKLL